jgi:hypothetical protein
VQAPFAQPVAFWQVPAAGQIRCAQTSGLHTLSEHPSGQSAVAVVYAHWPSKQVPVLPKTMKELGPEQRFGGGVLQTIGVPTHWPLLHASLLVQAFPSSHGAPATFGV